MAEAQTGQAAPALSAEVGELSLLDQIVDQGRMGKDAAAKERSATGVVSTQTR